MPTQFVVDHDRRSTPTFIIPISDTIKKILMVAGLEATFVVPVGSTRVIISGSDHYIIGKSTVALAVVGSFVDSNGMQDMSQMKVTFGETLHVISRNVQDLYIMFYS
ncbi:hypothetical protein LCGC14_0432960 [marine sediment metagenome]|uniref:Uncharacterized protein n=1 Tax=marine sediment metagenome TaxID=412755 RepID=A0A0F9V9Q2_9ZZZZ